MVNSIRVKKICINFSSIYDAVKLEQIDLDEFLDFLRDLRSNFQIFTFVINNNDIEIRKQYLNLFDSYSYKHISYPDNWFFVPDEDRLLLNISEYMIDFYLYYEPIIGGFVIKESPKHFICGIKIDDAYHFQFQISSLKSMLYRSKTFQY